MNFNKSIIATIVAATLYTSATSVIAGNINKVQLFETPVNTQIQINASDYKNNTVSGMKNQFDRQKGQSTFQWANVNQAKPDLGAVAVKHQVSFAADFYLNQILGTSTNKKSLVAPVLTSIHNPNRGALIAKYKQAVAGVEVFNREYNIMMDREFNLVASSGNFSSASNAKQLSESISSHTFGNPEDAISTAFSDLGGNASSVQISAKDSSDKYTKFNVSNKATGKTLLGQPRAKKVYFESKGKLQAAFYVEVEASIEDSVESDYYSYVISATSGKIFFKHNLANHADDFNYRIYADTETKKPWDSPHGNVIPAISADTPDATEYLDAPLVSLVAGPISTNDPWLADDATTTDGNNVKAYVDAIAPDGFTTGDIIADITSMNTFDYKYNTSLNENSLHNRKAATVNLFYVNNYLHNDFYDSGFDEAAGNAQKVNYERGGVEDDALLAEVQDNSGFNNANMRTPADGASPRMQMYLFDSKDAVNGEDKGVTVTSHSDIGLIEISRPASFGPGQFNVTADVVRIDDATDVVTDGCQAADNATELEGKIVIIDRGACAFTAKVKNAQNAGAIAVLIANNNNDGTPAPMGGADDTVIIPSMGLNFESGAAIYEKLTASETVSITMFNNKPFKGSSWDNGIVAHEWGHYISNRLVGNASGLINNQGRSMGEGWGDFHALLLLSDADDALIAGNEMFGTAYSATSYVANFRSGIRNFPYSTDMEINPLTFANVALGNGARNNNGAAEVHDAGEPWAVMLWDSYVALINDERHTFAQAQKRMKDYLVAGYKMTPIAPTYTEARDAVLAAAYANDVEDFKLILAAFARRGMGLGAVSPERFDIAHTGVVESFKTELSTFNVSSSDVNQNYEGAMTGYCSNDNILDKGETGTVSFTISNKGSSALTGLVGKVAVTSGHDVTFANDGKVSFDDIALFANTSSSPIEFTLNEAATADTLVMEITFPDLADDVVADSYSLSITVNMDFQERAPVSNSSTDTTEDNSLFVNWKERVMVGGELAKGTQTFDNSGNIPFFAGSSGADLGNQAMKLNNNGFESDVAIETKAFDVGYSGNFEMSFWHFYGLEADYDGGVVEISVNNSDWVDVTTVGGTFDVGYVGEVTGGSAQVLTGRPVFHGRNNADGVWGGMERINFGTALNGSEVKLRFRIGSDTNSSDFGWLIDNVTFSNISSSVYNDLVAGDSFACDNRLPIITAVSDIEQTVDESTSVSIEVTASDPNQDTLTYAWTQTSGTTVALTDADSVKASFSAPTLASGSETLVFVVSVNDGKDSVTKEFTVVVKDVPAVVPPTLINKSSGGTSGLLTLLLIPLAFLRRRK
jgi:hypothetical protein